MKKVLFLFPNTSNTPAIPNSIPILSSIAKEENFSVDYIDTFKYEKKEDSFNSRKETGEFRAHASFSKSDSFENLTVDIQRKINDYEPDIIAITAMSFEFTFLLSFFPKIEYSAKTKIVIGGLHSIIMPDEVINSKLFDLVVTGEGEHTFREILKNIDNIDKLSQIQGVYYLDKKNNDIVKNEKRPLIPQEKLWEIEPDFSLFDDKYFTYPFDGKLYKRYGFEVARGCPYSCTYCGNTTLKETFKGLGKFVRLRPLELIQRDMKLMIKHHNIELFYIADECFLCHPIEWLKNFSDWYGREVKKPFIVQTRPESVTQEKIDLLKAMNAPFFQVSLGVESGSERILFDVCNRRTKVENIIGAFDLLHQNSIRTCAFFMIGFPFETREDIWKSIELCRRIKPSVAIVSTFQPMPGQKLRDICIEEGFIKGHEELTTFTSKSILNMPQISSDELYNLKRVFMLYAYLPKKYYKAIEECEYNYSENIELYKELVELRWKIENENI